MMILMFGYEELKTTEKEVYYESANRLKGFYKYGPRFIDLGFCFQQHFGEIDEIITLTGELQSIAYIHFVQFPYTLKLIYEQIMTGYYLESQILIRHLFETLLQLKYFYKNPDKIKAHFEHNINVKKMVDNITNKPLYDCYRQLCAYTHGFIMKDIHRTDRKNNVTYVGNVYNEDNCSVPINYISEIMLGFINIYGAIFTKNTLDESIVAKELREYSRDLCVILRDEHVRINKYSKEWHESMSDLIF
ncbi:hypothetical protein [Clostridium tagluense]|uniref:hypothetical protein n=1 Tax=Clostridium tagluense TaxID=360422 RepID=UPI001CF479D2|nr:hypothetical protein [Clostridium tagluense]MCB2298886.1 hypothetical protein [Clostridium tagluense]